MTWLIEPRAKLCDATKAALAAGLMEERAVTDADVKFISSFGVTAAKEDLIVYRLTPVGR